DSLRIRLINLFDGADHGRVAIAILPVREPGERGCERLRGDDDALHGASFQTREPRGLEIARVRLQQRARVGSRPSRARLLEQLARTAQRWRQELTRR